MHKLIGLIVFLLAMPVLAEPFAPPPPPPPPPQAVPNVPPPPPPLQSGNVMEPGVTIIQTDNETIYEYRQGSHLYMVRVVPRAGPPYYFYDIDGDGDLDVQQHDPRRSPVNMWEIFRW